jgi:hypothetical protein
VPVGEDSRWHSDIMTEKGAGYAMPDVYAEDPDAQLDT